MTEPAVFVTGATGYFGREVVKCLEREGIPHRTLGRADGIDLLDPFGLAGRFEDIVSGAGPRPVLIHVAAMSRYYACEAEPDTAWRVNAEATGALMSVLRRRKGRMIYTSTDLVFDGERAPYDEEADARPLSAYGKSKLGGEQMVMGTEWGLIVRLPLLWGPSWDGVHGASDTLVAAAREGQPVRLFVDEWRTPLHVQEAASTLVDLLEERALAGIHHLPGPERLSRYELGVRVLEESGLDPGVIVQASRLEQEGAARPRDCSLVTAYETE